FTLFPHLSVRRNIAFGLRGKSQAEIDERVQAMVNLAGHQGLEDRYPHQLAGGQQPRVGPARALAPSPQIVLLDEPFAIIDPDLRSRMRMDLKRILKEAGVTAVFVTHDQEEAFLIADRIAVMNKGRIHQIGTPAEIYHNPQDRFVAEFVGKADFIPGRVRSAKISTEIGEFAVGSSTHVKDGEDVSVMLRPGNIDVIPTESGVGTIQSIEFKGEDTVYSVKLGSGQTIRSSQHAPFIHPVGTRVKIVANSAHLIVFDKDGVPIRLNRSFSENDPHAATT